jgi:hypothetical protein
MVVENKRLSEVLARVHDQQTEYDPNRRRFDAARQRPPNNMQAPGAPTKGRPSRAMQAASRAERCRQPASSHGLSIGLDDDAGLKGGATRPGKRRLRPLTPSPSPSAAL